MEELIQFIQSRLRAAADPAKAAPMAAYMKTAMPFYGVPKPVRVPIYREMRKRFAPADRESYEAGVRALWRLPHREEKYAALEYAHQTPHFMTSESLPLYETLIREGAWWDFVDFTADRLVGHVLRRERTGVSPILDRWIEDEDLWIRRAALIAQIGHKEETDHARLFDYCRRRAHEKEFFIRKAIGWALRSYSYTAPDAVRAFLLAEREHLSGLSFREGARYLTRAGLMAL